jgi:hypothetical protein
MKSYFYRINPNPHYFKAVTKAAAIDFKKPVLPHPLTTHIPVGGKGKGVLALQP